MIKTACVIPYHDDGNAERRANLDACLSQVLRQGFDDIVVVEVGSTETVVGVGYRHLFVRHEGLFNRGMPLNKGAMDVRVDLVLLLDADILLWDGWVRDSLPIAIKNKALLPYDHYFKVDEKRSLRLRSGPLTTMPDTSNVSRKYVPTGGALWIWKDCFVEIGGYDEEFVGHGGEDQEFYLRLGGAPRIPNWPLIHLWHPTSNMANSLKNKKLYLRKARGWKTQRS